MGWIVAGSGEWVRFPVEAVQAHAGTVDEIRDAMDQARSAVGEVTMDTQAYGQLCQFLPLILSPIFGRALEAVRDTVDALDETATNLRTAASNTSGTDTGGARRVRAVGGTGGRPGAPTIVLPL